MATSESFWRKYEIPTWLVAIAIYGLWLACVWFHHAIPVWLLFALGSYVIAWHFSLQHEAVHAFRSVPDWLRTLVVYPPVGLWLPWPLYLKYHSIHHRNTYLTYPVVDTESMYFRRDAWNALGPLSRAVYIANQTLAGRLLIGPLIRMYRLARKEATLMLAGDFQHLGTWAIHTVLLTVLLWFVIEIAGMPLWKYLILMAYPGFSLGQLRAFIEHRFSVRVGGRTAIVESCWLLSLLFLSNNLHAVHHNRPAMPWFDIRHEYSTNRERYLQHNENFVFRGYWEIARQWLLKPVFVPMHPIR